MKIQTELNQYSSALTVMQVNETAKRSGTTALSVEEENAARDAHFQLALMVEVSAALQRLLADGTVKFVLESYVNSSQWGIQDKKSVESIIHTIITLPDEQYQRMKASCINGHYMMAGICTLIALYALFHVLAAVVAFQLTMYTLLWGAALVVAPFGVLVCLVQAGQLTKNFNLIERMHQETDPEINFSAEFQRANGEKIACTQTAYQLAQGFFNPKPDAKDMAAETFAQYRRAC